MPLVCLHQVIGQARPQSGRLLRLMRTLWAVLLIAGCAGRQVAARPTWQSRLPSLQTVVGAAHSQPWGEQLNQIPATVIDVGELRGVPYFSFGAPDVELNVYGDPERPAALEIGTRNASPELRAQLRGFLSGRVV